MGWLQLPEAVLAYMASLTGLAAAMLALHCGALARMSSYLHRCTGSQPWPELTHVVVDR